ncbi:hypothetical protein DXG01_009003 [Tephrocybe rancida]|nr:hypothetical protein DXG01_009003 [Tephrocybe rancida]
MMLACYLKAKAAAATATYAFAPASTSKGTRAQSPPSPPTLSQCSLPPQQQRRSPPQPIPIVAPSPVQQQHARSVPLPRHRPAKTLLPVGIPHTTCTLQPNLDPTARMGYRSRTIQLGRDEAVRWILEREHLPLFLIFCFYHHHLPRRPLLPPPQTQPLHADKGKGKERPPTSPTPIHALPCRVSLLALLLSVLRVVPPLAPPHTPNGTKKRGELGRGESGIRIRQMRENGGNGRKEREEERWRKNLKGPGPSEGRWHRAWRALVTWDVAVACLWVDVKSPKTNRYPAVPLIPKRTQAVPTEPATTQMAILVPPNAHLPPKRKHLLAPLRNVPIITSPHPLPTPPSEKPAVRERDIRRDMGLNDTNTDTDNGWGWEVVEERLRGEVVRWFLETNKGKKLRTRPSSPWAQPPAPPPAQRHAPPPPPPQILRCVARASPALPCLLPLPLPPRAQLHTQHPHEDTERTPTDPICTTSSPTPRLRASFGRALRLCLVVRLKKRKREKKEKEERIGYKGKEEGKRIRRKNLTGAGPSEARWHGTGMGGCSLRGMWQLRV